jgi:hypothetical protein
MEESNIGEWIRFIDDDKIYACRRVSRTGNEDRDLELFLIGHSSDSLEKLDAAFLVVRSKMGD